MKQFVYLETADKHNLDTTIKDIFVELPSCSIMCLLA
jgi:hypothetical protein